MEQMTDIEDVRQAAFLFMEKAFAMEDLLTKQFMEQIQNCRLEGRAHLAAIIQNQDEACQPEG